MCRRMSLALYTDPILLRRCTKSVCDAPLRRFALITNGPTSIPCQCHAVVVVGAKAAEPVPLKWLAVSGGSNTSSRRRRRQMRPTQSDPIRLDTRTVRRGRCRCVVAVVVVVGVAQR